MNNNSNNKYYKNRRKKIDNYKQNRKYDYKKINNYNRKTDNKYDSIKKISNNEIINNKKSINNLLLVFIILISIFILLLGIIFISENKNDSDNYNSFVSSNKETKINYLDYYYPKVLTMNDKKIYKLDKDKLEEVGIVSSNVSLSLLRDDYLNQGYFKIKDKDFYIDYKDLKEDKVEQDIDLFWKNYIPYNESIKTESITNLYIDDKLIYTINESLELPIIIKEDNYYGIIYKDNLYYVLKSECEVIKNKNTDLKHTNGFSTLVYHATYDHENSEEKQKCIKANSTICLSDIQFDKQMKYLKDNNYYTPTMKDVEMFIDGKIQLPEHTALITIDDGYFFDAAAKVLEKYDLHATLFLIGILADLDEWKTESFYSKSIELHSHTYYKHTPNICSGGQGSILKCGNKEELLADLKKSREQLNGSTVFCYPFFEYNDYAINILKEAGFTMAFAGGRQKIKVGSNKMKLPRYGIINTSTLDDFIRIVS